MDDTRRPQDAFSQELSRLLDNPAKITLKPTTIPVVTFLGNSESWIVQTVRTDGGDTCFVQRINSDGSLREILPPAVTNAIARQRESIVTLARKRAARQAVETRRLKTAG